MANASGAIDRKVSQSSLRAKLIEPSIMQMDVIPDLSRPRDIAPI
jgi:hypothetical protein